MQDRPTAVEILTAVAKVLEETVVGATRGAVQHQARVAANLCRIVGREIERGPGADRKEREALAALLGRDAAGADTLALAGELTERIRRGDPDLEARSWPVLMEVVRGKLAVAKPGYDDYDFEEELPR